MHSAQDKQSQPNHGDLVGGSNGKVWGLCPAYCAAGFNLPASPRWADSLAAASAS